MVIIIIVVINSFAAEKLHKNTHAHVKSMNSKLDSMRLNDAF